MPSAASDLHSRIQIRSEPRSSLRELFAPLEHLLVSGGDARLNLDTATGLNAYGCKPIPCPDTLSFSSSTATSISLRGYDAAEQARDALMFSTITDRLLVSFDARVEQMRKELKAALALEQPGIEVIFSASGTDAQLQALCLTRAVLGDRLTTVVVAADQTGSGTAHTARGHHFSDRTSNGIPAHRGIPIGAAISLTSVALRLRDDNGELRSQLDNDALVLDAIETATARGDKVMLQVMDCSKMGWRAPSDACLQQIAERWPEQIQVVVDACQMRLGRRRINDYLDRNYMVLVTGSKYFAGPPFSGALLVPPGISNSVDAIRRIEPGLHKYSTSSDWPARWSGLRAQFSTRPNFGQWLRWEAALEEIQAYYQVPDHLRRSALLDLGAGIARTIAASPSLQLLQQQASVNPEIDDDEFAAPTIFAFTIEQHGHTLSLAECRALHSSLARSLSNVTSGAIAGPETQACLIGQPVGWGGPNDDAVAALRICISARHVIDIWSADADAASLNLQRELDRVATVVSKIEWLLRQR